MADLTLASAPAPALGPAVLTLADLTLRGGIVRSALEVPDQPRVILYGGAGWHARLTREGRYSVPGGRVRVSDVLADLARMATYEGGPASGEEYDAPPEVMLGAAYEWRASSDAATVRARDVLADLVARRALTTWRVDPASGRARFDQWPSLGAVDVRGMVVGRDLGGGKRKLGLDTHAATILPGATLEGVVIRRVHFRETGGSLRAEVMSS